jgi:oxygen-independent coproporphyrinogen-3 oxidase
LNDRSVSGDPLRAHHEVLDSDELGREAMWLGLRLLRDGVDRAGYAARFGADPAERFAAQLERLGRGGLLTVDDRCIRLTARGAALADEVALAFL